jgi:uncharacterized protein
MTAALRPEQVADYLLEHPDFLQHNLRLLAALELPKAVGDNTVSLHARQTQLLRAQNNEQQERLNAFVANAQASEAIVRKLHTLSLSLLAQRSALHIPEAVMDTVAHVFGLQQVAIRLWGVLAPYEHLPCAQPVDDTTLTFTDGLRKPYCGPNAGFSAVQWLPALAEHPIKSVALVALRTTPQSPAFGLVVLGSMDSQRFTREHDTTVLDLIGQVMSAALGRLMPD